MEINRLCHSSEETLRIYASDGIKKKLRDNTTDTFQKYRYICVETFYEIFSSMEKIPEVSLSADDIESCGSSKEYKITERIRALNIHPKFIDSVIEGTQKNLETLRMKSSYIPSFLS